MAALHAKTSLKVRGFVDRVLLERLWCRAKASFLCGKSRKMVDVQSEMYLIMVSL